MPARTPEEVHKLFAEAYSAADLDALMELYEPNATLVAQPGHQVGGTAAIREALAGFLAGMQRFAMRPESVVAGEDVAILFSRWTLVGTGTDGGPILLAGRTSDVVRRQPDGTWLIAIDNPYDAG